MIGFVRLHNATDKGGDQRSQFGKRRNIHQQGDIAADFLLTNLKLDMQKQNQNRLWLEVAALHADRDSNVSS
jgi:hypothetical protein